MTIRFITRRQAMRYVGALVIRGGVRFKVARVAGMWQVTTP